MKVFIEKHFLKVMKPNKFVSETYTVTMWNHFHCLSLYNEPGHGLFFLTARKEIGPEVPHENK